MVSILCNIINRLNGLTVCKPTSLLCGLYRDKKFEKQNLFLLFVNTTGVGSENLLF